MSCYILRYAPYLILLNVKCKKFSIPYTWLALTRWVCIWVVMSHLWWVFFIHQWKTTFMQYFHAIMKVLYFHQIKQILRIMVKSYYDIQKQVCIYQNDVRPFWFTKHNNFVSNKDKNLLLSIFCRYCVLT